MSCSSTAHDKEGLPADLIASDAAGQRSLKVDANLPRAAFGELAVSQQGLTDTNLSSSTWNQIHTVG